MSCVQVRNILIGEGMPKICVPLTGRTWKELEKQSEEIKQHPVDMLEWRMDYYQQEDMLEAKIEALEKLRVIFPDTPLLCTFRTKKEGGECELTIEEYIQLNKKIAASGLTDLLDIELFSGDAEVKELIAWSHAHQVKVILSNHDFDKTPAQNEIKKRLCMMKELGADIAKIAVMPQSASDVLVLLTATEQLHTEDIGCPLITMAMGRLGAVSRMTGEIFGSAVTFGTVTEASAPGQIPADALSTILELLH